MPENTGAEKENRDVHQHLDLPTSRTLRSHMTEDHPAKNAGPRIPRQRQPPPAETDPKEDTATPPACPPQRKKTKTDIAIEEAAARLAANAPPLSPEQRRRIAELFSTVVNNRSR